jgi:hypothetical protein
VGGGEASRYVTDDVVRRETGLGQARRRGGWAETEIMRAALEAVAGDIAAEARRKQAQKCAQDLRRKIAQSITEPGPVALAELAASWEER